MSTQLAVIGKDEVETRRGLENLPEGTWFEFSQNNSGGYFTLPGHHVFILANSEEEAWDTLRAQPGYTDSYCACCGERWYSPYKHDKAGVIASITGSMKFSLMFHTGNIPVYAFIT